MRPIWIVCCCLLGAAGPAAAAEFLIYEQEHWVDKLDPKVLQEYIASGKVTQAEYDARYRRHDIVDIYEDGRCKGDGKSWGGHAFRLVKVPGLSVAEARQYMHGSSVKAARRRFQTSGPAGARVVL